MKKTGMTFFQAQVSSSRFFILHHFSHHAIDRDSWSQNFATTSVVAGWMSPVFSVARNRSL